MITAYALIILPVITGVISLFINSERARRNLLMVVAFAHLFTSILLCNGTAGELNGIWLGLDALSRLFLIITSLLFAGSAIYSMVYLDKHPHFNGPAIAGLRMPGNSNAIFAACMQLFLAAMSLAILSTHFGLQWIGIEATTLASTPLIYYHRNRRSLEAAWKYMILCSVGIALALMGVFFLAMATSSHVQHFTPVGLSLFSGYLKVEWLKVAFIFFLVGYGAKMGLAPMHNWLPDAHSEAPSPVSAMLSGALLNCAFLGILRIYQLCATVPEAAGFANELLVIFGLLSLAVSGIFILHQPDYKRMLAYSSVEHMGILALGVGLGGSAIAAAMLHAAGHSLVKSSLFLLSGNILAVYASKKVEDIKGLLKTMPISGALWLTGFFAITGTPPFTTFNSEFALVRIAMQSGNWKIATLYLLFLLLVFIGMLTIFMNMCFGKMGEKEVDGSAGESFWQVLPPVVFLSAALLLGLYLPDFVRNTIDGASLLLGGKAL